MRSREELQRIIEIERQEKQEGIKIFTESLDKIVISETGTRDFVTLRTVNKSIEDKFYSFSYCLYPTGTEIYNLSIGTDISSHGWLNGHYNKEFVLRTYPKKYEEIFNELREAK